VRAATRATAILFFIVFLSFLIWRAFMAGFLSSPRWPAGPRFKGPIVEYQASPLPIVRNGGILAAGVLTDPTPVYDGPSSNYQKKGPRGDQDYMAKHKFQYISLRVNGRLSTRRAVSASPIHLPEDDRGRAGRRLAQAGGAAVLHLHARDPKHRPALTSAGASGAFLPPQSAPHQPRSSVTLTSARTAPTSVENGCARLPFQARGRRALQHGVIQFRALSHANRHRRFRSSLDWESPLVEAPARSPLSELLPQTPSRYCTIPEGASQALPGQKTTQPFFEFWTTAHIVGHRT